MTTHITAAFTKAFKEADIRGVYPHELDDEVAYFVARAFVEEFKYKKVVVARDMRLSSPALRDAFVKGATDAGASVVDLGMTTTPMLYFGAATLKLPGVMITASHSPNDHNGLKLVHAGAVPLTEQSGLRAIRARLVKGKFAATAPRPGKVTEKDITAAFTRFVLKGNKPLPSTMPVRVVVDVGNGMGALLLPMLAELGLTVTPLFPELDGRFPNRGSNPTVPRNQKAIIAKLKEGGYDFGIAFDGDADRVAFFDERGQYVNCGAIGALIAEISGSTTPKRKYVYTVLTSRAYEEAVKYHGGTPVFARVGHSYIKEVMRKHDAWFGCEHSGHFYFKDFFYTDSVIMTVRRALAGYQKTGVPFSALVAHYTHYHQTEDVMVNVSNKVAALADLELFLQAMKPQKLTKRDGLTADFGDAWVVMKPSVTEAAINVIAEGRNKKQVVALRDACVAKARTLA